MQHAHASHASCECGTRLCSCAHALQLSTKVRILMLVPMVRALPGSSNIGQPVSLA